MGICEKPTLELALACRYIYMLREVLNSPWTQTQSRVELTQEFESFACMTIGGQPALELARIPLYTLRGVLNWPPLPKIKVSLTQKWLNCL